MLNQLMRWKKPVSIEPAGGLKRLVAPVAVATFPASFAVVAYDSGGGLNRPPIPKVVAG
jgi:hypothetical protein